LLHIFRDRDYTLGFGDIGSIIGNVVPQAAIFLILVDAIDRISAAI